MVVTVTLRLDPCASGGGVAGLAEHAASGARARVASLADLVRFARGAAAPGAGPPPPAGEGRTIRVRLMAEALAQGRVVGEATDIEAGRRVLMRSEDDLVAFVR